MEWTVCTGAMNWVQKMTSWRDLRNYNAANRTWFVNGVSRDTEMYVKEFDRFHFYWVLGGGHSVSRQATSDEPIRYIRVKLSRVA